MARPRLPHTIGQCRDQTHHTDHILVQVYADGRWTHGWNFDTFHDVRDVRPRVGSYDRQIGEFNTFNADLVSQALMEPERPWPSWRAKLLNDEIAFDLDHFEVAREYARRLRDHGRWAHEYDPRYAERPMRRLDVRLVRVQIVHLTREFAI